MISVRIDSRAQEADSNIGHRTLCVWNVVGAASKVVDGVVPDGESVHLVLHEQLKRDAEGRDAVDVVC